MLLGVAALLFFCVFAQFFEALLLGEPADHFGAFLGDGAVVDAEEIVVLG